MSAPLTAAVLRELGAELRTFRSLKDAVRWYDAYGSRQQRITKDLATIGTPMSRSEAEKARATHAALMCCFRPRDPGIDDDDLTTLIGPTLSWICGAVSRVHLADEQQLTEHQFSRWVARGETVLRGRLRARGLLVKTGEQEDD